MSLNSGFITQGISKSISDHFNAQPGYVGRMLSTIAGITTYTTGSVGGMNNQGIWLEADGTTKFYAFQGKYAFAFYAGAVESENCGYYEGWITDIPQKMNAFLTALEAKTDPDVTEGKGNY
tara:strand:+ start:33184 stop:33546 length:363 start_codon:yes stop_codon:yes gene_type:complete